MSQIASDGLQRWRNNSPGDDAIRSFRTRNREVSFRNTEYKGCLKLRSETFEPMQWFFDEMHRINNRHPGILSDPGRVWIMDALAVGTAFGQKTKSFADRRSHRGGSFLSESSSGNVKHVNSLIVASASYRKTAPFFVAGKIVTARWLEPITIQSKRFRAELGSSELTLLTHEEWFPRDGVVQCSERV